MLTVTPLQHGITDHRLGRLLGIQRYYLDPSGRSADVSPQGRDSLAFSLGNCADFHSTLRFVDAIVWLLLDYCDGSQLAKTATLTAPAENDRPPPDFFPFSRWLERIQHRQGYAALCDAMHDFVGRNYPCETGEVVYVRPVQRREVYSISTATDRANVPFPRMREKPWVLRYGGTLCPTYRARTRSFGLKRLTGMPGSKNLETR